MDDSFRQAVFDAAPRDDVRQTVHQLYNQVQQEIDLRRPVCIASGRCCHFETYGHRLFVTTLELAAFLHDLPGLQPSPPSPGPLEAGCPFQTGKLCAVHSIRPFGCRMFFCDPSATPWMNTQYERFHQQIQQLHRQLSVPYFYLEWRQALRAVGGVT